MQKYIERKDILNLLYNKKRVINNITLRRFEILLKKYNDIKVILEKQHFSTNSGKNQSYIDIYIKA